MPTYSTRPAVPDEAISLAEDIYALKLAIRVMQKIEPRNVTDDPDKDKFWFSIQRLKEYERFASRKLAVEYLDPRRKKIERR